MKNTQAPQEKKELSLRQIRELMNLGLSPALGVDDEEAKEWFGVNADDARREYIEDTGHTP